MVEPIRVLLVDDETDFAEVIAENLRHIDDRFEVRIASGKSDAFSILTEAEIDCIVSDYDMPHDDGLDLLKEVRADHPELPFILITGKGSESIASTAINSGVTDYLMKGHGSDLPKLLANRIEQAVQFYRTRVSYRDLFEQIPDGVTLHDPQDGSIVDTNQRFCEMLGYSRDEVLGMEFSALLPEEEPFTSDRAREHIERAKEEGPQTFEWVDLTSDGEYLPVEVNLRQTHIQGRQRILAVVRDISERKQDEEAIEALHDIATTIQSTDSIEAVCERTVGAAENILEFYLCAILINEDDWLVPYAVSEDTPPMGARRMGADQGLAGRTFQRGESIIIDDIEMSSEVDPARETYRSGISIPIGEHGVFQAVSTETNAFDPRDIELAELLISHTEHAIDRLAHEADLRKKNERLDEFASVVSHDLRNPLTVAKGRLELAKDTGESEHLEVIEQAHTRMDELIEQMLTLARQGESVDEMSLVSLEELASECWRTFPTPESSLIVNTDRSIIADPTRLRQLLENLFRNAVEHVGDEVTVTIGTLDDGFYVEDDGSGIPQSDREQVFDIGYSTTPRGTGVGLNIVQNIVHAHDWAIEVTDGQQGGARFEITGVAFG